MTDSNSYFPPDLLIEILLKLPVKSLLRFRAVSKSWHFLISSSVFISTHLNQTSNNPPPPTLLLRRYDNTHNKEYYSLFGDCNNPPFGLDFSSQLNFPFSCDLGYFRIVGSCNGIMCLCDDYFADFGIVDIILWNPSIQKFITLPLPLIRPKSPHMFVLGFGADNFSNNDDDYKLVRLVYHKNDYDIFSRYNVPPEVEIYSLNTGVWRRVIGVEIKHCMVEFMWSQAFVNGAVHWIAYDVGENGGARSLIMSFSIADEVFGDIMLPDALAGQIATNLSIMVFEGSLAVVKYEREIGGGSCEVWVMKRYGVLESWTRFYSINLDDMERVVGFRNNGEVLFSTGSYELISYDPNSGHKKDLGVRGSSCSFYVQNYMESLVLLQRDNVVSDEFLEGMGSLWIED